MKRSLFGARAVARLIAGAAALTAGLAVFLSAFLAAGAGAGALAAPSVLSPADVALYGDIFEAQERGDWKSADKWIKRVEDPILMGYVKHQRYMHPTAYRSRFNELKAWMAYYADHPNANEIYRLALKRRPKNAKSPVRPQPRQWRPEPSWEKHPDLEADYQKTSRPRLKRIEGRVRYLTRRERALDALKEIERHRRSRVITERQFDRMRTWIAASLYYQGYVEKAGELAAASVERNADSAVLGLWISGLIAFRESDVERAFDRFSHMASVPYQDEALRAGAGYWAARAALAAGRLDAVGENLEIAAAYPFTFYGQLALGQLGRAYDYQWTAPTLTDDDFDALAEARPAARRAAALVAAGRTKDADLELRWLVGAASAEELAPLMGLAASLGLPAAQLEAALAGRDLDASPEARKVFEAGLYPIPTYAPDGGFETDRALLYALMRQESKFKVEATSRVGARGLMQLMPRTASFVARDRSLRTRRGRDKLYNPAVNLKIGQRYVNHLISASDGGSLFDVAVAYNGGPGNLRRWKRGLDDVSDPLLFIESIPNPESRDFVEKVLTNVWVYRARLGQPAPSRDRVAAGDLPVYEALDQLLPDAAGE